MCDRGDTYASASDELKRQAHAQGVTGRESLRRAWLRLPIGACLRQNPPLWRC